MAPSRIIWQRIAFSLAVLGMALVAVLWYQQSKPVAAPMLHVELVRRGDLHATVTATGTIEPEEVVDVGAQVVGMIKEFGRDPNDSTRPVDYLTAVAEGTVLVRIDDAVYRARRDKAVSQVEVAQAEVEQDEANLRRSEADLLQAKAKHLQAERDWARAQKLIPAKAISEAERDAAQAAYEVSKANVGVSEASIDQARAAKRLAEKALNVAQADGREAQQNLDYTVIRSPVKGTIIDRRVNVGQTVVSSLNAPSLFLIAKDLKRLQVWGSVNEADVGRIHSQQLVRFTVDAFPDETFTGRVSQVRLNATMTQNVVTYTVVVDADNSSEKLIPYLTANLQFDVGSRHDVLRVPNAALRWQPRPDQIAPIARETTRKEGSTTGSKSTPAETRKGERGLVWVEERGLVRPVEVRLGLTDGLHTEVVEGDLDADDSVVVGDVAPGDTESSASPFAPRMFGSKPR